MRLLTLAAISLVGLGPSAIFAQQNSVAADPCARYKWDVSRERALFAAPASPVTAAKTAESAPHIATDRSYRVTLAPAAQVTYSTAPGKPSPEGSYSGILAIHVPVTGSYRISVDAPIWIDVVADSQLVPAADYEAEHGCDAPRKIVQFALQAKKTLWVQLSGATEAAVRIAVVEASGG